MPSAEFNTSLRARVPWVTGVLLLLTSVVVLWNESIRAESAQAYFAFLDRYSLAPAHPLGLLTAWALHGSWSHWGINAFQLAVYGGPYERERGHFSVVFVFFVGHLAGCISHLAFGGPGRAIGMSAGTWALIGAVVVDSLRRDLPVKQRAFRVGLGVLALVMWFAFDASAAGIAAHIGGVVSGGFVALLVNLRPRLQSSTGV